MILRAVSLSLVGLLMGAAACDARAGGGAATTRPGEGAGPVAPEGNEEGDSPEELELRLERLVNEQADQMKLAASDSAACEELCSLATSICGVQEKLCVIADERPRWDLNPRPPA